MQKDFSKRPFGLISSPPDDRDYSLSKLMSVVGMSTPIEPEPDIFEYEVPDIKDQGDIWLCVSASGCVQREIIEKQQTGEYKKLSIGFNYTFRENWDLQEKGLRLREYLKGLVKYGIPEYEYFQIQDKEYPFIKEELGKVNLPSVLKNAHEHRITAFANIKQEEIKLALRTLGPVLVSISIYTSFGYISATNPIIPIPDVKKERVFNGHCLLIIGYNNQTKLFKIANSYGKGWADNGCCYASYDYKFQELWSITDLEKPNYTHDFKLNFTTNKTQTTPNNTINLSFSTFDSITPLGTQTIECRMQCGNSSSQYTYTTNSKGIVNENIVLNKVGVTKITCSWKSPDNKINTKTINVLVEPKQINPITPIEPKKIYSLSISSDKSKCNVKYIFYITIKTSAPNQLISLKTIRSNGKIRNTTEKTDNKGEFEMGFAEGVVGIFKQEVSWKDGNNEIRSASVNVNIVK